MSVGSRLAAMQPIDVGIAGPTPHDMARAFRSVRADPLTYLLRVRQEYGDLVAFPVPGPPALLVSDPADVVEVLQSSARRWGKRTVQYAALGRVTGPGLLASADPSWLEHRRLAAPAFHHRRLVAVSEQVRAAADHALAPLRSELPSAGRVVDVAALVHGIGLDAVGRALFSTDLSGHAQRLLDATSDAAELVVRLGRSILPTAAWTPTPTNVRLRVTRRRLESTAAQLIAERRTRRTRSGASDGAGQDLLGLLLDSGLEDAAIRDELVTMIVAGHETVAAALTWTAMLLAEHPEEQDRVRAELTGRDRPVTLLDHRDALPRTRAVVDEALRLYPPAWAVSRRTEHATVVGGVDVPAGTMAIISPWVVHRRAESWADPGAFDPERFLARPADRSSYLPFGMGPRLCIGREFALGEMVVVLSVLLTSFRLGLPDGWQRPHPQARVAVHPRGGMPLLLTPLAGAARG